MSETANKMGFLSDFNSFVYLLYLRQRKEMQMAWLANAHKFFKKLQTDSRIAVIKLYLVRQEL